MAKRKPWITVQSRMLAISISDAIRFQRTEKEALEKICVHLRAWGEEIDLSELGCRADYGDALLAFYEAGGIPGEEPFDPF